MRNHGRMWLNLIDELPRGARAAATPASCITLCLRPVVRPPAALAGMWGRGSHEAETPWPWPPRQAQVSGSTPIPRLMPQDPMSCPPLPLCLLLVSPCRSLSAGPALPSAASCPRGHLCQPPENPPRIVLVAPSVAASHERGGQTLGHVQIAPVPCFLLGMRRANNRGHGWTCLCRSASGLRESGRGMCRKQEATAHLCCV